MPDLVCGYGDVGRVFAYSSWFVVFIAVYVAVGKVAHSLSVVWCSWSLPNVFSAMLAAKVDTRLASAFLALFVLGVRTFFLRPLVSVSHVFEAVLA